MRHVTLITERWGSTGEDGGGGGGGGGVSWQSAKLFFDVFKRG